MDIVDAQVHSNLLGLDTTLGIMDALGIQSLVIDEWLPTSDGSTSPSYRLPGDIIAANCAECRSGGFASPRPFLLLDADQPV